MKKKKGVVFYQIMVKTLNGKVLTFNRVPDITIIDNVYVKFVDQKTKQTQMFAVSNTEIREVNP